MRTLTPEEYREYHEDPVLDDREAECYGVCEACGLDKKLGNDEVCSDCRKNIKGFERGEI